MRDNKALERAREIAAALKSMEVGGVSGKYRGPYLLRMQDALTDAADLLEQFIEPATEPLTNAERIRAMGDEEIMKFMQEPFCDKRTHDECSISYCGVCDQCILDWLQQPAPEEEEKL